MVFLAFACDKCPVIAECRREVGGAVSGDGQAGAEFWSVGCEASENGDRAGLCRSVQDGEVAQLVSRGGDEMEYGAVVPGGVAPVRIPGQQVGDWSSFRPYPSDSILGSALGPSS